ncbi:MAG: M48 family metallopeptidase [Acidobacteriota bacterium]
MKKPKPISVVTGWLVMLFVVLAPLASLAQTEIVLRKNKYSAQDDVQLGRQAAAEIEKKLQLVRDPEANSYLEGVGARLAEAIPPQFQHPEFDYYFKVVDAKEINAFALPGGPMYVNTGMIAAAKREGEMAGVMAHEIAHVALRHGTAQATKAAPYQTLGAIGQIGGAILGGALGGILGQGSQLGVGVYMLKFSREYETEADILGAQILARAGYDPRDLAAMFRTIEEQGAKGGPEFLSSHPSPANRYQRIEQEASALRFEGREPDSRDFSRMQARIANMPNRSPDRTNEGWSNRETSGRETDRGGRGNDGRPEPVEPPSSRFRTYSDNRVFSLAIPENWADLPAQDSVWFAPQGGYGDTRGQATFTHGVNVGVSQSQARDLRSATSEFISGLQRTNASLRQRAASQRTTLSGRNSYYTSFSNTSDATGRAEVVEIFTTQLRNGDLFYVITVVPQNEYQNYQGLFQRITRSLKIN